MAKKKIAVPKDQTPKISDPAPREPAASPPDFVLGFLKVCEVLELDAPQEFPPPPSLRSGFATICDPGLSIVDLRASHPSLFSAMNDWYRNAPFAKQRDIWKWRQIRVAPMEPGKLFEEQSDNLVDGETPAPARAIVTLLIVHHLVTNAYLDIGRLRCSDKLLTGQRVLVGPFGANGLELASCSDRYSSPSVGLSAAFTHEMRKTR